MRTWLAAIISAIVQALVAILTKRSQPTAEDGAKQPKLRGRLRNEVRRKWSGKKLPVIVFVIVLLASPGCATRTIYVASGEPVRLREMLHCTKAFMAEETGNPVHVARDKKVTWS